MRVVLSWQSLHCMKTCVQSDADILDINMSSYTAIKNSACGWNAALLTVMRPTYQDVFSWVGV